jgi:hypothetical protein
VAAVTFFADLTPYTYFHPEEGPAGTVNVGWLDPRHPYTTGATSAKFRQTLRQLCRRRMKQTRGFQPCYFCRGPYRPHGSPEIRMPGRRRVYAAPELVYHYVAAHGYRPPEEFVAAVLALSGLVGRRPAPERKERMGAELWYHRAPWHPEPGDALRALQDRFFSAHYNLPAVLRKHLRSARQAVLAAEAEGDPYELADLYGEEAAMLERLSRRPIPEGPTQQIKLLRKICASSGQGIGNVLDVLRVSNRGGILIARRLPPAEMTRLVGSDRPTVAQARAALGKINEELRRGEAVCFPLYAARDRSKPIGWYFIGNTVD